MSTTSRLVRLPEVLSRTGFGRSALYAAIADGAFPAQVKIGKCAVGWVESEIDEWIAARPRVRRINDVRSETRATV